MGIIPPVAEFYQCAVHESGNVKYGPFNWRTDGPQLLTYIKAISRHLAAVLDGQWLDPESGLPHVAHIATSCNILLDSESLGLLLRDTMPPPGMFPAVLAADTEVRKCTSQTS